MEKYINFIKHYITLSAEAEEEIRKNADIQEYQKGDNLLEKGKVCERIYFLSEGTTRVYFYRDGKDITYWVYPSGIIFTSWHSYFLRKPSKENIEVLEKSIVVSLTYNEWQDLYIKFPELEHFVRMIVQEQMGIIDDFYKGFYFLSAKEKYELFIKYYPSTTQHANLGHIASMLGVSLETLSRVRRK